MAMPASACRALQHHAVQSVDNHLPYLPLVTNPENNPCIPSTIRIATKI